MTKVPKRKPGCHYVSVEYHGPKKAILSKNRTSIFVTTRAEISSDDKRHASNIERFCDSFAKRLISMPYLISAAPFWKKRSSPICMVQRSNKLAFTHHSMTAGYWRMGKYRHKILRLIRTFFTSTIARYLLPKKREREERLGKYRRKRSAYSKMIR